MEDYVINDFKGKEREKRKEINLLMQDWKREVEKYRKEKRGYYFASDGFFPNYFNQKIKILFIGREARHTATDGYDDYIATFMKVFFVRYNQNINAFTRRVLYIVEGVKNNGKLKFKDVKTKTANCIAKEMLATKNYGYAIMNMSKYSNEGKDGGVANKKLINDFLEHSSLVIKDYFQKEIKILSPDFIITDNLWNGIINKDYLKMCFGVDIDQQKPKSIGSADLYEIKIQKKPIKLINTYHFSSQNTFDNGDFYYPIMKLIFG
jgi:hypothetical protein